MPFSINVTKESGSVVLSVKSEINDGTSINSKISWFCSISSYYILSPGTLVNCL